MFGIFKRRQPIHPVEKLTREMLRNGSIEHILATRDAERTYIVMANTALTLGFSQVRDMEKDADLSSLPRNTNIDLLALEKALFYLSQYATYIQTAIKKTADWSRNIDGDLRFFIYKTAKQDLEHSQNAIEIMYSKAYPQKDVNNYMESARIDYANPHQIRITEIQANRLFKLAGRKDFSSPASAIAAPFLRPMLSAMSIANYTHMVPAFIQSMNTTYKLIHGRTFPDPFAPSPSPSPDFTLEEE